MPTSKRVITQERLHSLLDYETETGLFRWRVRRNKIQPGEIAGGRHPNKSWRTGCHISVGVDGKSYMAHRLAWFYVHGNWPQNEIDHINGDGSDNRIANLRLATRSQNAMNTRCYRTNKSGFKGVQLVHYWKASIFLNGREKYLGSFKTAEAAHDAYADAARKFFGEFARTE